MKLTQVSILIAAVLITVSAQPLDLPTNNTLGDQLPDEDFSISRTIEKNFLPVEPALLNILHFMGVVSGPNPYEKLSPRTYSAPGYRQIQITSYTWTQARYLLWGIYKTVLEMIQTLRFHDSLINLYFRDRFVGRMKIESKIVLALPGPEDEDTEVKTPFNRTVNLEVATQFRAPISTNETAVVDLLPDSPDLWNSTETTQITTSSPPTNTSVNARDFFIDFEDVAGAQRLRRNDVFVTFYTAILHLAQLLPGSHLSMFETRSPFSGVYVRMYGTGSECLVSFFIPSYLPTNEDLEE